MTFEELLDQAIDLLQRRGRLTYCTLKRQFHVDDDVLEDLKEELIYGQRLAVDEDGRVLVWIGGASAPLESIASPPLPQEGAHATPGTPAASPSAQSHTSDAERRQLTVLFCDLVDSTVLASQLDPEDLREVVRAYQETCAKVIARFEEYIAQYLGDGLLVYFGYPVAHEDDAQRAVRTGLGIVEALGQLNARLAQERGVRLAVRLGIHTGLVVVGEVGGGTRQEQLALGETPNLAARLQGIATPNTVVISAATLPLLGGFFAYQSLGTQLLRGLPQPLEVCQVLHESMARSRLEAAGSTSLTPLVGREQEVALLRERWAQVKDSLGQVVLLSGEAGIGKSRLVQVLKEHVAAEPQAWLTPCQCSPYYQNTALYPMIDLLERVALRFEREESLQHKLSKLEGFVVESGLLQEHAESYELRGPLPPLAIPATLHDSLMARLDRLATVKALAQLGATLGREFSYALLRAVSPWDESTLQRGLHQLVEAEFLYQQGLPPQATYLFKHALIQEAAYQSLLRSTRQQHHQRIAQVLTERFPEMAETQPELVAHHYTEAGLREQAIPYWQQAGQRALQRSANLEAVSHVTRGLEVLHTRSETPERAQQELALQIILGAALGATKGQAAPEAVRTYARACELARQVGNLPELFPALWGFWYAHMARGQLLRARELTEEFLGLARQQHDPLLLAAGHRMVANTAWWQGELVQAYFQQGLAFYDPVQHRVSAVSYGQDSGVVCGIMGAVALWMLGYPDQALQGMEETLALARRLAHPMSLAVAFHNSAISINCAASPRQPGRRRRRNWRCVRSRASPIMEPGACSHGAGPSCSRDR